MWLLTTQESTGQPPEDVSMYISHDNGTKVSHKCPHSPRSLICSPGLTTYFELRTGLKAVGGLVLMGFIATAFIKHGVQHLQKTTPLSFNMSGIQGIAIPDTMSLQDELLRVELGCPRPCCLCIHSQGSCTNASPSCKHIHLTAACKVTSKCNLLMWLPSSPLPPSTFTLCAPETKQDSMGFLGTKAFLCPHFLFLGNKFQPP